MYIVLLVLFTSSQVTATPPAWRADSPFESYNDLSWSPGQRTKHITRYTTNDGPGVPSRGNHGFLKDYHSGEVTSVTLTVEGGLWNGGTDAHPNHTNQGSISAQGTDARSLFHKAVDTQGVISYGSSPVTLTFRGLNPAMRYEVVVYGNRDRPKYNDRFSTTRIIGAETFRNESSSGAQFLGPHDDSTVVLNGNNTETGYVARFTRISAGSDQEFVIEQSSGPSATKPGHYINAVFLKAVPAFHPLKPFLSDTPFIHYVTEM